MRRVEIPRLKIRKNVYKLVRVDVDLMGKDLDGDTDPETVHDKEIRINDRLRGRDELETYLHEILHAAVWDLTETAVTETTHAMAVALYRLGYRRDGE